MDGCIGWKCCKCGSIIPGDFEKCWEPGCHGTRAEAEQKNQTLLKLATTMVQENLAQQAEKIAESVAKEEIARLQQENSDLRDAIKAIKAGQIDETLIEEKDREIYDLKARVEELEGAIENIYQALRDQTGPVSIRLNIAIKDARKLAREGKK